MKSVRSREDPLMDVPQASTIAAGMSTKKHEDPFLKMTNHIRPNSKYPWMLFHGETNERVLFETINFESGSEFEEIDIPRTEN